MDGWVDRRICMLLYGWGRRSVTYLLSSFLDLLENGFVGDCALDDDFLLFERDIVG